MELLSFLLRLREREDDFCDVYLFSIQNEKNEDASFYLFIIGVKLGQHGISFILFLCVFGIH